MKLKLLLILLVSSTLLQPAVATMALPAPSVYPVTKQVVLPPPILPATKEMANGKRLNFLQRLEWKMVQKRMARYKHAGEEITDKQRKQGKLSMILGIAAIVLIFIPYVGIAGLGLGIAAVILGAKSMKGNSNTQGLIGLILGSLTLLLFIVAVIAVAALLSGWN